MVLSNQQESKVVQEVFNNKNKKSEGIYSNQPATNTEAIGRVISCTQLGLNYYFDVNLVSGNNLGVYQAVKLDSCVGRSAVDVGKLVRVVKRGTNKPLIFPIDGGSSTAAATSTTTTISTLTPHTHQGGAASGGWAGFLSGTL